MIVFGAISGLCQDNSPLTPDEGRLILGQLQDLQTQRREVDKLQTHIARDLEQDARERETAKARLELEQERTKLEQERTAVATDRAALYEQLYRSLSKGPGVGCRIMRVITVGIYRCN